MELVQYIDNVQLFRGFLIAEGWGFCGDDPVFPTFLYNGKSLDAQIKIVDRPDVVRQYLNAPLKCGFQLRCIVTDIVDTENIEIFFKHLNKEILIPKPAEAALAAAYWPLSNLNTKFFNRAKSQIGASVIEIGARARSGNIRKEHFGNEIDYIGFDIVSGENVDVVGDAHRLTEYFDRSRFDFAYSVSVFEHLMWPWKVAIELGAVLKPGGWALMQSHPVWPKHEMPWDFFRFWDSGWRSLFCEATGFRVLDTVEVHEVDLVARQYTGNDVHHWDGIPATLASAVLAEKIAEPTVSWTAIPPLAEFGSYPF